MKTQSKTLKKILRYLLSPFALGLAVTAAITSASIDYYASRNRIQKDDHSLAGLIQQFHEKTIDWRLIDRGPQAGSERVAILAIDERSIEQEGRFPWPRDKMAKLVEHTLDGGAKIIAFDVVYSEADANSAIPALRRLKRDLSLQSPPATQADQLIDTEMSKTDGDRIFANTIKKYSDRLVMGAYFDVEGNSPAPYQVFCKDAAFDRTYQSRYWKKEASPLKVVDVPLNNLGFPQSLKSNMTDHLALLEITRASHWFQDHPEINGRIKEALGTYSASVPEEAYAGFATLWLSNDIATAKDLLQQTAPEIANDEGARMIFDRFGSAFLPQHATALLLDLREAAVQYCKYSLTDQDDLVSFERYSKLGWTDAAEEQFKGLSLATAWTASRKPSNADETLEQGLERFRRDSLTNEIQDIERWWVSIPVLADVTKHTGFFNAKQDSDGTIRRSMLLARQGTNYMPSLALKTFLTDKGHTALARLEAAESDRHNNREKELQPLEIQNAQGEKVMTVPVDTHGNLMINYAGAQHMFPHVSAADLLADSDTVEVQYRTQDTRGRWITNRKTKVNKKDFLKDKLFILGATAIGIYDLRVTPFEENYPGVETHANVLSNLLIENDRATGQRVPASAPGFLRTHPQEDKIMWFVLIALGVTLSALLSYFGSIGGLGLTAGAMTGIYVLDRSWLFGQGILTTILFPQLQVFGTFVMLTFYRYFTEERKKRELKGTFEKYVSPSIVAEVLSDPENIELGGKKMSLTVMFSDVRGFTKISEKLDPRELSDLLNSYLTPMTNLVFKNKGTLDKYMGDAIMAFWGAPIHFPDHAAHACRCALQMIEKLRELQKQYRDKGLPEIDIGIGLNTGEMSVGNMGSDTVRSYTVMGDAVNLGSRLEGINKQYGTRIIISEFTREAIQGKFVTREVDWVRVKGKEQPVRIFELVCEGAPGPEKKAVLEHFEQGLKLYHAREFTLAGEQFERALAFDPNDAVSQLYIERCADYLREAPPEHWDGVFTMTSK